MTIFNRYIRRELIRNYALVNILLLGLFGFIDLAVQLEDVGEGNFGTREAVLFTLYHLPRRLIDLFPFAALLASVLVLGAMASNRELVVMRGSGLSPMRIAASLMAAGGWLLAGIVALEIFIAPGLQQQAFQMRATALAGQTGSSASSLWARSNAGVVYIGSLRHGRVPAEIEVFELGQGQRLQTYLYASRADILAPDRWRLHEVTRKQLGTGPVSSEQLAILDWTPILSTDQLRILDRPPASLSVIDSYRYVRYLRGQGQNAQRFNLSLWQKLALPLTALAMMLLAAPLTFVNPRGANLGLRIVASAGIGLAVYTLTQVLSNLALLLNLSAPLIALTPPLLIAGMAWLWLRRIT